MNAAGAVSRCVVACQRHARTSTIVASRTGSCARADWVTPTVTLLRRIRESTEACGWPSSLGLLRRPETGEDGRPLRERFAGRVVVPSSGAVSQSGSSDAHFGTTALAPSTSRYQANGRSWDSSEQWGDARSS